jgi:hypothetical protein
MIYYPLGETPAEQPEWLQKELEKHGMPPELPVWLLDDGIEDWSAPAGFLFQMPPNYPLLRHGHPCYRTEIIVQGSLDIGDGRTATAGDVFTALPGELYGPHTAGPEGCTSIEIFSELRAMFRLLYEGPDGSVMEADALNGELPPDFVPFN